MAKEVKSINVHPSAEAGVVKLWQLFGWEFHSTQEVVNNYQEQRGNDTYHVHEKHIKLTFQRNNKMPHYNELVDLENRYYSLPSTLPQYEPEKPKKFGVGWIILIILGICFYVLPGIILLIYKYVTYPGKLEKWKYEHDLWVRRDEIKNEEILIVSRAKELTQ